MFISCLRDGVESAVWKAQCVTAQQLVWSVSTLIDGQNRQILLKLVPELLQKLRVGLESISFSPFETAQLFKQLEVIHLARLRGAAIVSDEVAAANEKTAPAVNSRTDSPIDSHADLHSDPLSAPAAAQQIAKTPAASLPQQPLPGVPQSPSPSPQTLTAPSLPPAEKAAREAAAKPSFILMEEAQAEPLPSADPQHMALVGNIAQGTWFEIQGAQGERFRCRLAAVIRSANKYIFVNRAGVKVAEESRESLALALQQKRLTILDDGMLFDRALESVITNLREQRPTHT